VPVSTYVHGIPRARKAARARRRLLPALAAVAGHVLRLSVRVGVQFPGLAGAGAVCYGAWLAWAPAGFVVAGMFMLALDRRAASGPAEPGGVAR
jgi:hypothetical protein